MTRASEHHLLPQPKEAPRWKGLTLKFLFWIAGYAAAGLALFAVLSVLQWR